VLSLVSHLHVCYPRGTRVVVRTQRGLELGEVLSPPPPPRSGEGADGAAQPSEPLPSDGTILRRVTPEDELLAQRLAKNRLSAQKACQERLESLGLSAVLLDTEFLFDGQTLIFYFLGEVPAEVEGVLSELAEAYESRAGVRAFAQTLLAGCGPDCGTKHACSDACGSCATRCALAGARRSHRE
jgi:cell fate regulator YaaT (PSP1 superfamily)